MCWSVYPPALPCNQPKAADMASELMLSESEKTYILHSVEVSSNANR
jgi:hypothetical protein